MSLAAVPEYAQGLIDNMPPGHRFGTFFKVWQSNWSKDSKGKQKALEGVLSYPHYKPMVDALLARQKHAAANAAAPVLCYECTSISPFMTGTGMEHPLENGFAFMAPYGLPYLPGSGLKGVLRHAAELLAKGELGDDRGWSQAIIDDLFGPDTDADTTAKRGALECWDTYIDVPAQRLGVDILTPHFGEYYQGSQSNQTPHTSGEPTPVPFLVVPPGAGFCFHISCSAQYLTDPALAQQWQTLTQAALETAVEWLGFGAKTNSGYGQLQSAELKRQAQERQREQNLADAGIQSGAHTWQCAKASYEPGSARITVTHPDGKHQAVAEQAAALWKSLGEATVKRYKKKKKPLIVNAQVEQHGNQWTLISLQEVSE